MPSKTFLAKVLDPKLIEKQNAAFHRMSNKRQRVAIAEDVLAQLKLKKYLATPGTYVRSDKLEDIIDGVWDAEKGETVGALDLQTALLSKSPDCNVCGLGAAFCSMARLGDQAELSDVENIHEHLEPIFGMHQIALIEFAFEGEDAGGTAEDNLSEKETDACYRFYDKRPDEDKRLAAIFRNIVKNDGSFKP